MLSEKRIGEMTKNLAVGIIPELKIKKLFHGGVLFPKGCCDAIVLNFNLFFNNNVGLM